MNPKLLLMIYGSSTIIFIAVAWLLIAAIGSLLAYETSVCTTARIITQPSFCNLFFGTIFGITFMIIMSLVAILAYFAATRTKDIWFHKIEETQISYAIIRDNNAAINAE